MIQMNANIYREGDYDGKCAWGNAQATSQHWEETDLDSQDAACLRSRQNKK
jgi:hypothetical protein